MIKAEHFDLSILESFRAVESAIRRAMLERQISPPLGRYLDLASLAQRFKLLPASAQVELDRLRPEEPISSFHGTNES